VTGWLLNLIPWWVYAVVAGLFLIVTRSWLGSWRNVIAVAGVALGAILSLRGFQKGWAAKVKKDIKDADKVIAKANKARADADAHNADPGKLHESDGFKRDD